MIHPEIPGAASLPGIIHEDKRNGHGYWVYLPNDPVTFTQGLPELRQYGDYLELAAVVDTVEENGSVLVQGAPGSGKSHLVRDIQAGCVISDIPCLCLTLHVNAGKREGIMNASSVIQEFREQIGETGGLIILDNVDYMGYHGSSRRRGSASAYARWGEGLVKELATDPNIKVIGTAHDADWRSGRWTWRDPEIDEPSSRALESFNSRLVFEGKMSLVGLAHIIREASRRRGGQEAVSLGTAAAVIRALHKSGRANFFHANHIDPKEFLANQDQEIARIEAGRSKLRNGA